MKNTLQNIMKGTVVVIGIGNVLRSDDAVGPRLIERLQGTVEATCIDAGTAPENYSRVISQTHPDVILFIDAVHLQQEPGTYTILEKEDIVQNGLTTHDISPKMFIEYLESQTNATIYMLGIQPQDVSVGDQMTPIINETINELEHVLQEVLNA